MRRIFSSFFAWLEDEDYIAKSPVRRIHKVKTDSLVKEVLSDERWSNCATIAPVKELVKFNRADIDFTKDNTLSSAKETKSM